ncbi:hypothetical protein BDD43_1882 [Mucilaginibacter gracilis]|uniref:Uncharacterized protein n=1 Tax=Mucilaginibacter gracilis TaxID=423350 RepID=A0A495IZD6_9SPHI|nr:hypothetical protein BDD43_1882 [Mucilaginibacter gracilis]
MYIQLPKYFKYENYTIIGCVVLLFILCGGKAYAQSVGAPIVNITFGTGTA